MPKMKSKKGASKRFRLTASGKIKRGRMNKRHILTKKGNARKRRLNSPAYVSPADEHRIAHMLKG